MKTRIKKQGDTVTITIDGKVDHETQEPFRNDLARLIQDTRRDSVAKKFIFDLSSLEFVGSSGITSLIQSLKEFNQQCGSQPTYQNVASEFQKIIRAFDTQASFHFLDTIATRGRKPMDH